MDRDIYHTFRDRHRSGVKTIATEGEELERPKGVFGPRKEGGGAVDLLGRFDRGRGNAGKATNFAKGEGESDDMDVLRRLSRLSIDNNDTTRCNR